MNTVLEDHVDLELVTESYGRRFAGPSGEWMLKVQGEGTLDLLRRWPQASVLDVGGAHGQVVPYLVTGGYPVSAFSSDPFCEFKIRDYVSSGKCSFYSGSFWALPFPDKAFDVALSFHMLSHLTHWREFLSELIRVARKAVIVDFPTKRSINGAAGGLFWLKEKLEGNTRNFISYTEAEVKAYFESQGFEMKERSPKFFFPMVVHRMLQMPTLSAGLENIMRHVKITEYFGSPVIACYCPSNEQAQR